MTKNNCYCFETPKVIQTRSDLFETNPPFLLPFSFLQKWSEQEKEKSKILKNPKQTNMRILKQRINILCQQPALRSVQNFLTIRDLLPKIYASTLMLILKTLPTKTLILKLNSMKMKMIPLTMTKSMKTSRFYKNRTKMTLTPLIWVIPIVVMKTR